MRRENNALGCVYIIVLYWLGAIAYDIDGWKGVLYLTLILVGIVAFLSICSQWLEKQNKRKIREEPCTHGVPGAKHNIKLCKKCQDEADLKEKEYQAEAAAKKEREKEEKRKRYSEWLAQIRLPEYVTGMDPHEFEKLVCQLFARMGYKVESTPYVGDNGSDGYLFKDDKKSVLQCKRVKGSVGEPILRDLFGTMHAEKCDNAIVVTTGAVSKQARAWIIDKPIRVIEFKELQQLLIQHFNESDVVPSDFCPTGTNTCPQCGKQLREMNGRRGRFLGCTGYPNCRFTRPIISITQL
jgi:restriction system protein